VPDITFFSKARLTSGYEEFYTWDKSRAPKSRMLGDWRFYLTSVKPVEDIVAGGRMDFVGYEETYSNPNISQEETDVLWQRYLEETGQAK